MTATAPDQTVDASLVLTLDVVDVRPSKRKRLITGIAMIVTGVVMFAAFGIGANNGDAAFEISQTGDRWFVPTLRFPGGAAAMLMGVIVVALGVGQLVRGYPRSQMRWVLASTLTLFVLAFLCWAGTGNPANPISLTGLVANSIVASIPYVLGAMAGIVCERSGVINIAIEGQMLVGAFAGALFASSAGSLGIGLLASVLGGALIAVLLAVFAIRYLVNQVILGVVLNALALGLTNLGFHSIMAGDKNSQEYNAGAVLSPIKIPVLGDIPVIGQAFFDVNIIVYITYVLVILIDIGLFRTRWGLRTRAVGEHPKAADTMGIKVNRIRYRNVLIGGLIAGLAGATLTIGGSGQFNANISSGKGFIALAAVIFGRWTPIGSYGAALLFAVFDSIGIAVSILPPSGNYQQLGDLVAIVPENFYSTLPYIMTIVILAGVVGRSIPPAALGQPYVKEGKT
jgi:simple sugar transport system permease protein